MPTSPPWDDVFLVRSPRTLLPECANPLNTPNIKPVLESSLHLGAGNNGHRRLILNLSRDARFSLSKGGAFRTLWTPFDFGQAHTPGNFHLQLLFCRYLTVPGDIYFSTYIDVCRYTCKGVQVDLQQEGDVRCSISKV